jgi:L-aspartate oxidase
LETRSDFLVIGSGIAGLDFALKAARSGTVTLLTKRNISESATFYAQGGIASVLSEEDTFESHIKDTLYAGAGLCDTKIVELVVRDGPARINELIELGVKFSERAAGAGAGFDLGKEGGHSKRRIVHAEDLTGRAVEQALVDAIRSNPDITVFENHIAVDLISHSKFVASAEKESVWGAYALDKETGMVNTFLARATVVATGGAGKVYLYTSNPDIATGDGIAMSYRVGAEIANMEFIQFHPTACTIQGQANIRGGKGEGAVLRLRTHGLHEGPPPNGRPRQGT